MKINFTYKKTLSLDVKMTQEEYNKFLEYNDAYKMEFIEKHFGLKNASEHIEISTYAKMVILNVPTVMQKNKMSSHILVLIAILQNISAVILKPDS